jgi:hypothetical protein
MKGFALFLQLSAYMLTPSTEVAQNNPTQKFILAEHRAALCPASYQGAWKALRVLPMCWQMCTAARPVLILDGSYFVPFFSNDDMVMADMLCCQSAGAAQAVQLMASAEGFDRQGHLGRASSHRAVLPSDRAPVQSRGARVHRASGPGAADLPIHHAATYHAISDFFFFFLSNTAFSVL